MSPGEEKIFDGQFADAMNLSPEDLLVALSQEIKRVRDIRETALAHLKAIEVRLDLLLRIENALSDVQMDFGQVPDVELKTDNRSDKPTRSLVEDTSFFGKRSIAASIRSQTRSILLREGRPMTRREIHDKLVGVTITARDPTEYVGRVLRMDASFVHHDNGYWLAEHPL